MDASELTHIDRDLAKYRDHLAITVRNIPRLKTGLETLQKRNYWKRRLWIPGRTKREKEEVTLKNYIRMLKADPRRVSPGSQIEFLLREKRRVEYEMAVKAGPWC